MKQKWGAILVILLLAVVLPVRSQDSFTLKKDIFVGRDEIQDNIFTMGAHVQVEGKVRESVVVIGGTVVISGEVHDSVVGIGTNITLSSTAAVGKDVVALGGLLTKEPGCVIGGDTVYFKSADFPGKFLREAMKGVFAFPLAPFLLTLKLILVFIWVLLALVVTVLLPRQVGFASSQVRTAFWPVFATGLLAIVVFAGLIILSALFSIIIIGLPILLSLIVLGIIIKVFGTVALFHFFGDSLSRAFGSRKTSPFLAVILGLVLVNLLKLIPVLGFLFSLSISVLGWGVTLRTKFGTTENWFKRK